MFDGATALKYARSRHSTSDFSRALRQQQIIKAVLAQMISTEAIFNVGELYAAYQDFIHTNITVDEMLGAVSYVYDMPTIHSFVYTMECNYRYFSAMSPACMLYP